MPYRVHRATFSPYFTRSRPRANLGGGGRGLGSISIAQLAAAITRNEGFYPGSLAYQNNNPGNLTAGPGMIGMNGGFAVFPDLATGQAALQNQIQLIINRGLTLSEFFQGKPGVYAGYDKTDPSYASKVSSWLGIPIDQPLSSLVDSTGGVGGDVAQAGILPDATTGLQMPAIDLSSFSGDPLLIAAAVVLGVGVILYATS